jgi:hypothetical protein
MKIGQGPEGLTVKRLDLEQEPFEPAPCETGVLLELAGLVDLWVLRKLRPLNQY